MNLALFQQKLPDVSAWIERTLQPHRATAIPVASLGFERLGAYFPAALLTTARVIHVAQLPVPPLSRLGLDGFDEFEHLAAAGITYHDYFFVRLGHQRDESLHFHELVHVVQWQHLGPERFFLAYGMGYVSAGGYRQNPLEVMAYDLQARFDRRAAFDAVATIRAECDRVVPGLLSVLPGS